MDIRNEIKFEATERYWAERAINWETHYFSPEHPHRKQMAQILKNYLFHSVLEVGCGAGANLYRLKMLEDFGSIEVMGCDINKDAVAEAQRHLKDGEFKQGMAEKIPFADKCADLVITDACLIYVPPEKIEIAKNELLRVAKKYLLLCEWHGQNQFDGHWCYDYQKLFDGYNVKLEKIISWGGSWEKYGTFALVEVESKREH